MIQTTYGIVKKATYRVQTSGTDRECVFSGSDLLKMINEWKEEINKNWQNRPCWPIVTSELPHGTPLSIHPTRSLGRTVRTLILHLAVCDLDLDTKPEEREKWKERDWRSPYQDDYRYVRLYRSPTNAVRPILCKTVTYTITREG